MWPSTPTLIAAVAITLMAGWVRGVTGFGAAMVMTPPLALLLGAPAAVPIALMLETFAAAPMLPGAARIASWRMMMPIGLAAVLTVPLGAWALASADPELLRRLIAITVIVFSLLMLSGRRYRGRQRVRTSVALGAVSGGMLGATGIGGPPVILYLLAGPDRIDVTRANLTLYVALISAVGLVAMVMRGLIDTQSLLLGALMAPGFMLGVVVGSRAFAHLSDARFRRFTILLMLAVAIFVLIA